MDLKPRMALAGRSLLAMLNPDAQFLPTDGFEPAHDLGRWWDAVLRLEDAIGFVIPAELEAASLRNLQQLTDNPDGILLKTGDHCINPHNFRESLLAFEGLVTRRRSAWAGQAGLRLVDAMTARATLPDGSFDCSRLGWWGQIPDPSQPDPRRNGWFDGNATSGRCLEGLVWFYEATGEDRVLRLAEHIAEHHLANSIDSAGDVRKEIIDPGNAGHNHSYHGTLRGLLLFGLLTRQARFIKAIEATYRRGVRGRIVRESGWASHDLGKTRYPNSNGDPVGEPASTGDSAQLALWLALRAGATDLLDDVERLVRARLLPMQLTEDDIAHHPGAKFARRDLGAWLCPAQCHAGKGCIPDVTAAVAHTLCDMYRNICTRTAMELWVNLHFDYADADLSVTSRRTQRGEVTVTMNRASHLMIRIPGWAPASSLRLTIDERQIPVQRLGQYARISREDLKPHSRVVFSYDLPERFSKEHMPSGRSYTFKWRGDEIVGISPQDEPLSFYPALSQT